MGPGVLLIVPLGAKPDTVWVGAPGEPLPAGVALRVKDSHGDFVSGASITWEPIGRGAHVLAASGRTDRQGLATAVWQLGTAAAEEQQLRVLVQMDHRRRELLVR